MIPAEDKEEAFPVHAILLTDNGIHIMENVRTDFIAAEAASTKRGTFFLSMTVPRAAGTTGTFVKIQLRFAGALLPPLEFGTSYMPALIVGVGFLSGKPCPHCC